MKAKPVILSGGSGVRLWPISRKNLAKQFVDLFQNDSSLFMETIKRVSNQLFTKPLIISNNSQRFEVLKLIKKHKLKTERIILESIQRNTAPACVVASFFSNPEEILCIMPSDHYIEDSASFLKTINESIKLAAKGHLVTVGAKILEADSNYGYILPDIAKKYQRGFQIKKFIEKPTISIAKKLIKDNALWNTGIIIIKNSVLISLFKKYQEDLYKNSVLACKKIKRENEFYILPKEFLKRINPISIDYAILEKKFNKIVVPYRGEWSDLGTYESIYRLKKCFGNVVSYKAKDNFTYSDNKLLVIAGIDNHVIVNTKNAILVTKKNSSALIREAVEVLLKKNRIEALDDATISRPWGLFENIKQEKDYKVKKLLVLPGEKISLQKHIKRSEHWVVITGTATITKGKSKFKLKKNESTFIKKGEVHRIENNTKKNLILIEVQTGDYLEEDDIYRFEDKYNR